MSVSGGKSFTKDKRVFLTLLEWYCVGSNLLCLFIKTTLTLSLVQWDFTSVIQPPSLRDFPNKFKNCHLPYLCVMRIIVKFWGTKRLKIIAMLLKSKMDQWLFTRLYQNMESTGSYVKVIKWGTGHTMKSCNSLLKPSLL